MYDEWETKNPKFMYLKSHTHTHTREHTLNKTKTKYIQSFNCIFEMSCITEKKL